MKVKDEENQLKMNLNLRIGLCILVWALVFAFISYRLWKLMSLRVVEVPFKVARIKEENELLLRGGLAARVSTSSGLPIVRAEPFD